MQYSTAKKMNDTVPPASTWLTLTGTCPRKETRRDKLPTACISSQKVYEQAELTPGSDRKAIPLGGSQGQWLGRCRGMGGGAGELAKLYFLHVGASHTGMLTCANSVRSTRGLCIFVLHLY